MAQRMFGTCVKLLVDVDKVAAGDSMQWFENADIAKKSVCAMKADLERRFGQVKSDFEAMVISYGEDPSTSGLVHKTFTQDKPKIHA